MSDQGWGSQSIPPDAAAAGAALVGDLEIDRTATLEPDAPRRGPNLSYIPALDGIRAFAVLSVMAFHGGLPFLPGGFLGVDTFFVLSGFLITTLLIGEWGRKATIKLGAFWARRARRLLPALLLVLLFVAFYAAVIVPRGSYPDLRLDALSSLFYVANWHFILSGSNYFAQTGPVSPLTHTWSLAIEEQFYLIWPLLVLGVLHFTKSLRLLLGICVVGAVASATEMFVMYHPGGNLTRLYYGTDTHAQCMLVGAALSVAMALLSERRRRRGTVPDGRVLARVGAGGDPAWVASSPRARALLTGLGVLGAVVSGLMWWHITYLSSFLWRGGFALAALATACVLISVICAQRSPVAAFLSHAPLRFLGRISYGMYLWHFPLFLWIDHARTGLSLYPLFLVRCAVTIGVSVASFYLVERPIRQGTFFRAQRAWIVTPIAALLVVVALIVATEVPAVSSVTSNASVSPALVAGPPVRILLLGDSTALTLGVGLSDPPLAKKYNFVENDQGILGCGVTAGSEVQLKGVDSPTAYACNPSIKDPPPPAYGFSPSSNEPFMQQWKGYLTSFKPNVVALLAGRWEVVNRTYQGSTFTDILNPTYAAYVKKQLQASVDLLTSTGAHLVILTAPCYNTGEQPSGQPWPEDSPARLAKYNDLVRQVGAANPDKVTIENLNGLVCPGGNYQEFMGGVQVRQSDGVHFTIPGGEFLAPKILPTILEAGRSQMATAKN